MLPVGGLLLLAQPLVVGLAFALWILHDGVTVLNTDCIAEAANRFGAAPEIAELALLIESGGIPNHMIVNMGFVNVRTDDIGMIAFCEPTCQLAAQTICLLRRDLTGTEGLAEVVSNHIIRTPHSPGVSDILLLGKQELPVGNTAVALPACNESSAICLFRVCYIVNDGFDCGANCPTLSGVQRHQPRGRQMVSPPDMIMKCGLL